MILIKYFRQKLSIFISLNATLVLVNITHADTLNLALEPLNKSSKIFGQIELKKSRKSKGKEQQFITMEFESKSYLYKLDVTSPIKFEDFEEEKKIQSRAIIRSYGDSPTPYIGEVTNLQKCSKKFQPTFSTLTSALGEYLLLKSYVGKGLQYGVCDKKQIFKLACTSFIYEKPSQQFYKLIVFSNQEKDCQPETTRFIESLETKEKK